MVRSEAWTFLLPISTPHFAEDIEKEPGEVLFVMYGVNTKPFSPGCILNQPNAGLGAKEETYLPTLCSEMFQIKPYADKPSAFGLSVHSFVGYERISKWDEEKYRKGGRKPYFIKLDGTPRWINLYAVADADVYYNYEA